MGKENLVPTSKDRSSLPQFLLCVMLCFQREGRAQEFYTQLFSPVSRRQRVRSAQDIKVRISKGVPSVRHWNKVNSYNQNSNKNIAIL